MPTTLTVIVPTLYPAGGAAGAAAGAVCPRARVSRARGSSQQAAKRPKARHRALLGIVFKAGDVAKEQADGVVDELFSMAKRAILRQVNPTVHQDAAHKDDVVIPEPRKLTNGNGNGAHANGNGNGKAYPDAAISAKQKSLIIKLAKERGQYIENLDQMGMAKASELIKDLLAVAA